MHLCCFDVKYVMHSVLFHVCRARFGLGCFTPNFMYRYGAVVVRGLATTSDKSPAVKFYCPVPQRNIFYAFFILVLLPYARYSLFMFWFLIHFLLVVVALPKKTCLSMKNLLVLVVLEHGVSVEGKVVEVVLNEEL